MGKSLHVWFAWSKTRFEVHNDLWRSWRCVKLLSRFWETAKPFKWKILDLRIDLWYTTICGAYAPVQRPIISGLGDRNSIAVRFLSKMVWGKEHDLLTCYCSMKPITVHCLSQEFLRLLAFSWEIDFDAHKDNRRVEFFCSLDYNKRCIHPTQFCALPYSWRRTFKHIHKSATKLHIHLDSRSAQKY